MPSTDPPFDTRERVALCDLFERLGPDAPTLLDGFTTKHLAAHLLLRERDPIAAPCLVLPGPPARFAERRTAALVQHRDFSWLVDRLRSGPPFGFFRLSWVRDFPSLNEFFVHHEDVRRANGEGPRTDLTADLQAALWRNVERGSRFLARRVRTIGVDLIWDTHRCRARPGDPVVELSGAPGELLLYLFGRQDAARVDVLGPPDAVAAVRRARFGM
ncbi:TIGR03085 family metal-binding protein [Mycolicibacterium aichiense]|uniref:TIGR03085 family protein n=1 Tax=Mycolicibacterium aichiense TaxID=1799 RepID=A0AAD1MEI0_9MYCO|nr:TIGR03085 family metal-binding protein [Mycolicibacterium aichiense]MCV7016880.1 TIGR03085 family protein [Mycolicibacterium aichiense]BBX10698.1 TIGR03085 family protein [Mycolicibacterium aichiense]STZ25645.1 TIGR03085 family protein [Mycolicibacterium aichiense]